MGSLSSDPEARLLRARRSLEGLSLGDALGNLASRGVAPEQALESASPWCWTDDTAMALVLVEHLERFGQIDQDELALEFAARFESDPYRGYGRGVREVLDAINCGIGWSTAASRVFRGVGSLGNGAAMRVAPLGGYFADDPALLIANARASAEVTHAHIEGQAGAIAVALAAAFAASIHENGAPRNGLALIASVWEHTPPSLTRDGIRQARTLLEDPETSVASVVPILGNGMRITAADTIPFTLWCAARYLDDYPAALQASFSALGDADTNAAIVGGIVSLAHGLDALPAHWIARRESIQ